MSIHIFLEEISRYHKTRKLSSIQRYQAPSLNLEKCNVSEIFLMNISATIGDREEFTGVYEVC